MMERESVMPSRFLDRGSLSLSVSLSVSWLVPFDSPLTALRARSGGGLWYSRVPVVRFWFPSPQAPRFSSSTLSHFLTSSLSHWLLVPMLPDYRFPIPGSQIHRFSHSQIPLPEGKPCRAKRSRSPVSVSRVMASPRKGGQPRRVPTPAIIASGGCKEEDTNTLGTL